VAGLTTANMTVTISSEKSERQLADQRAPPLGDVTEELFFDLMSQVIPGSQPGHAVEHGGRCLHCFPQL
jgi:hypothetical protein